MSGFTKSVTFKTTFDGDEVVCKMDRLSRKDMAKFAPYIDQTTAGEAGMKFSDHIQMLEFACEVLPSYVKSLHGLKDAGGEPLELDTVLSESYFMQLVADILRELLECSMPHKEDEKNSGGQSVDTSEGSAEAQ